MTGGRGTDKTQWCEGCKERQDKIERLRAENQRLRDALREISENWYHIDSPQDMARKALGDDRS